MCLLTEIPYRPDSCRLFDLIARRQWSSFLDSGHPLTKAGRYDILTADPYATLCTRGLVTELRDANGSRLSSADPFALLRQALGDISETKSHLPFQGGALGWFGYDLGRRIERLPCIAQDAEQLPEMAIGLYDWAVVVDHQEERSWLVGQGRDERTHRRWLALSRMFSRAPRVSPEERAFHVTGSARSNLDRRAYESAFDRIKTYIRNGDCYQVNLARRFSAPADGDGWSGYQWLRQLNPAPFAAYLNTPIGQVLSSSPERLLRLTDDEVETKPIKGTRPRDGTPERDSELAKELAQSPKDRAENLMIVDLMRNDIGRVCRIGSIRVPRLFAIESYATVHHMVSTVTGRLREDEDAPSLLRACFPGGSITGAPKVRAMEIIEELEPHRRGLYCGSIGYIGFDGSMDTNIAIRTLVYSHGEIRCWAGGAIVQDSDVDAEYQETSDKAAAMLRFLEPGGQADVGS